MGFPFGYHAVMGILARIFGAVPAVERDGARLDVTQPFWEVSGKSDFPSLLAALPDLLSEECILYFEDGSPTGELLEFLRERGIPEKLHIAYGTLWPKPSVFHLPSTTEIVDRLGGLMSSRATPELAVHFHVYRDRTVLLEWHDAFTQPMLISGELPEHRVRAFAERLRMSCKPGCREGPMTGGQVIHAEKGGSSVAGRDLQDSKWMYAKAVMFVIIGVICFALVWARNPTWQTVLLLLIMIWAFARAYYFAFYVIEKYVDPGYRFSGILSFLRYCLWSKDWKRTAFPKRKPNR
jgi:hypothetical protein